MSNTITRLSNLFYNDRWDNIMLFIKKNSDLNFNESIENDNNIFHLVCIKGKTKIIDEMIDLSAKKKIILNIDLANGKGYPGLHLYYMNGGNDKKYLKHKNICILSNNNISLIDYFYDKINLLEVFIDNVIKYNCFETVMIHYNILGKLITKYMHYNMQDKVIGKRYFKIIIKIYEINKPKIFVFIAIYYDAREIIKYLISNNHKFTDILKPKLYKPLGYAVKYNKYTITEDILQHIKKSENNYCVYKYIHDSSKNYNYIAIMSIIENNDNKMMHLIIKYMEPYIEEYKKKHKKDILFYYFDNSHNTYLHRILFTYMEDVYSMNIDILLFFIKHTDLNMENYVGVTCAQLIFKLDIWRLYTKVKKALIGREIDMLKSDNKGNNCYTYVDKKYKNELLKLTKQIKIPISVKNTNEINKLFNEDTENKKRNYGLFGTHDNHFILYLKYIDNKYTNVYIPKIIYDSSDKQDLILFHKITSPILDNRYTNYIYRVSYFMNYYYSWLSSIILWYNKNNYYIYHKLEEILKEHDNKVSIKKERYIILYILIIHVQGGHANTLIYDRKKKEAWRFEPYGVTLLDDNDELDDVIHKLLENVYGDIVYYDPDKYLKGLNFQLVDMENYIKNIGDPGGYCLAWCIWFMDIVLMYNNRGIKDIIRNFLTKKHVSDIITKEEGTDKRVRTSNYYLDFIRRYAHKLDNEKNKILKNIGILNYDMYNYNYKHDDMNKIINHFKVCD